MPSLIPFLFLLAVSFFFLVRSLHFAKSLQFYFFICFVCSAFKSEHTEQIFLLSFLTLIYNLQLYLNRVMLSLTYYRPFLCALRSYGNTQWQYHRGATLYWNMHVNLLPFRWLNLLCNGFTISCCCWLIPMCTMRRNREAATCYRPQYRMAINDAIKCQ